GAEDIPGRAQNLPRRRVEHLWVRRVHGDVGSARLVVDEQHLLPCLAAVVRAEHAALGVWSIRMSNRRDVHDLGIGRMNLQTAVTRPPRYGPMLRHRSAPARLLRGWAVND